MTAAPPDEWVAADPGVTAEVVRDVRQWDGLQPEWDELFRVSPTASPPLRFAWLRRWWDVYGPAYAAPGGPAVLTVRRGPRLIGALPLYVRRTGPPLLGLRRLRFLSTGEAEAEETCPDYLDLLHRPGEEGACLDALERLLATAAVPWDEIELSDVSERSPLARWGRGFPAGSRAAVTDRGGCPIADLAGGFEAYLGRLSANSRQQARRLLRGAAKAGAGLDVATTGEDVATMFDQLVALHQRRWTLAGKPGCFAADRFTALHRSLAERWVPDGHAVLARLSLGGAPLAVLYGFVVGAKFDFYQSGVTVDDTGPLRSPGITAHLALMEHLAGRGLTAYDFLRGSSAYKDRLATGEARLACVRITRAGLRTRTDAAARLAVRALRRAYATVAGPGRPLAAEPPA
jgi:CelD/BcsL family acetyltransferase involved in cellulose biosynthesis